jgi:hypothetical protein
MHGDESELKATGKEAKDKQDITAVTKRFSESLTS